jgi:hypothetical protein
VQKLCGKGRIRQNNANLPGSRFTILTLGPLAYKFPLLETVVVLAHQETEKCKLKFTQDFGLAKNKKKFDKKQL